MVFSEDETVCNVAIGDIRLEQVQAFEYLCCVANESGTENVKNKAMQGRNNNKGKNMIECARVRLVNSNLSI